MYNFKGELLTCMGEIITKLKLLLHRRFLKTGLKNEAEVRYAICDPLITAICSSYGYVLELEDSVKEVYDSWQAPPANSKRSSIGRFISDKNRGDYSVYNVLMGGSVAVIALIEAKNCISENSVAQAIGYYSKAAVSNQYQ